MTKLKFLVKKVSFFQYIKGLGFCLFFKWEFIHILSFDLHVNISHVGKLFVHTALIFLPKFVTEKQRTFFTYMPQFVCLFGSLYSSVYWIKLYMMYCCSYRTLSFNSPSWQGHNMSLFTEFVEFLIFWLSSTH